MHLLIHLFVFLFILFSLFFIHPKGLFPIYFNCSPVKSILFPLTFFLLFPDLFVNGYAFDRDGIFYSLQPDGYNPHKSYMDYIETLPLQASPSVFGMHDNAQIASANAETFSMFDIYQSLEGACGGGSGGEVEGLRDKLIETVAIDINNKIQGKGEFDIELIKMTYPVEYEQSMNTVLIQECIRYNKLINTIMISLPDLLKAIKGLVVMSNELESIANSLAGNQVPGSWSTVAYPSMKPCSAWCDDLFDRLQFISGILILNCYFIFCLL